MASPNPLDEAAKNISFQSDKTRRQILLSYWLVVLLAVPLWWTTTSITRLTLPKGRVNELDTSKLRFNIELDFDDKIPGRIVQEVERGLRLDLVDRKLDGLLEFSQSTDLRVISPNVFAVSVDERAAETTLSDRRLIVGAKSLGQDKMASYIKDILSDILIANFGREDQHTVQYSPRYRLAFSLMCEDASAGGIPLGWEVESALSTEGDILPVSRGLHALHNFTIESQVQYFAPLAFDPLKDDAGYYALTQEQLSVFVNSEEWTLASSVSNDPVLHFIIFVPSANRRPLRLLDEHNVVTESTAFSIPQWGSIFIYNPPSKSQEHLDAKSLHPIFAVFQKQLLTLLGVASPPFGVKPEGVFSGWQLDALLRRRAYENAGNTKDTLKSIVNLVDQIESMPVDKDVTEDVEAALGYFENMLVMAPDSAFHALQYSAEALARASRAFFNPGMLALLYFPPEHNLAVYTPLLAPVAVPLVAALFREVKRFRARKSSEAT